MKRKFLDTLIPAYKADIPADISFFSYAHQNISSIKQRKFSPHIAAQIQKHPDKKCLNIIFGKVDGEEIYPSEQYTRRIVLIEFFLSLIFLVNKDTVNDYRFLSRLHVNMPRLPRIKWVYSIRTLLIANYFSLKVREIVENTERGYVLVYYNAVMLGIVKAYREKNKEVWDIQHGLIGPGHQAYCNPDAFRIRSNLQPSGLLVWDKDFGKILEAFIENVNWRSTDYAHLKLSGSNAHRNKSKVSILYSLQWNTKVPECIQHMVEANPCIVWKFRLHPFEKSDRKDLSWIDKMSNATISDATEPLNVVLMDSALHITVNSSVVFEAASLGVYSFIFISESETVTSDIFSKVINKKMARIVSQNTFKNEFHTYLEKINSTL